MSSGIIIILILLVVVVFLLIAVGATTYNSLVELRNRVKDQWAQIDVELKRRFDLIPNVVEVVKGYAKHEKETFEDVVKARNSFTSAETPEAEMKADGELTKAITKLFALSEAYPELKVNESFQQLQGQLANTEEKIARARQFYNDIVLKYNNKVERFPSNIMAGIFGFKKEAFFSIDEKEKENVKVKF